MIVSALTIVGMFYGFVIPVPTLSALERTPDRAEAHENSGLTEGGNNCPTGCYPFFRRMVRGASFGVAGLVGSVGRVASRCFFSASIASSRKRFWLRIGG
jgi:hypothetical protein